MRERSIATCSCALPPTCGVRLRNWCSCKKLSGEESQSPQAQSWSSKARCCLGTSSCPVNPHQSPVGPGTVCDVEVLVTRRLLPLICSLTARQRNLVWPVAPFDVLRRETSGQWIQSRTLIRALHQLQGFISTEPAWRAVAPASTLSASTLSATTTTPDCRGAQRLVGHSPCSEADSLEDSTRTKDAEKKRKRDRLRLIVLGAGSWGGGEEGEECRLCWSFYPKVASLQHLESSRHAVPSPYLPIFPCAGGFEGECLPLCSLSLASCIQRFWPPSMNSSTLAPKLARSWPWLWYCSSPASTNLRAPVPSCVRGSCLARALWRDGARESKYSPLEKLVRSVLKHGHPRVDVEEIGEEVRAAEARPAPKSWLALTFNAVVVSVAVGRTEANSRACLRRGGVRPPDRLSGWLVYGDSHRRFLATLLEPPRRACQPAVAWSPALRDNPRDFLLSLPPLNCVAQV